jgi:hypothetical protein
MPIILSGYIHLKILPIEDPCLFIYFGRDSRSADPGDRTSPKQWACRIEPTFSWIVMTVIRFMIYLHTELHKRNSSSSPVTAIAFIQISHERHFLFCFILFKKWEFPRPSCQYVQQRIKTHNIGLFRSCRCHSILSRYGAYLTNTHGTK